MEIDGDRLRLVKQKRVNGYMCIQMQVCMRPRVGKILSYVWWFKR